MASRTRLLKSLMWGLVFTSLVPLLVVGGLTIYFTVQSYSEALEHHSRLMARMLAEQIESDLDNMFEDVSEVVDYLAAGGLDDEQVQSLIRTVVERHPHLKRIVLLDEQARVRFAAPESSFLLGANLSDSGLLAGLGPERPSAVRAVFVGSGDTVEAAMAVAYPGGYIVGGLLMEDFVKPRDGHWGGHGLDVGVVSADGRFVAHTDRDRMVGEVLPMAAVLYETALAEGGEALLHPEGEDAFYLAEIIGRTDWMVVVRQPLSDVFAPVWRMVAIYVLGAAGILAMGLVVGRRLAQRIHASLSRLRRGSRAIAQGDYAAEVREDAFQEFAELSETFNSMAADVREREARIKDLNRELSWRLEEMEGIHNYVQSILDSMPSVLVSVDPLGRLERWNRQAELLAAPEHPPKQGTPAAEVFPQLSDMLDAIPQALSTGQHVLFKRRQVGVGKTAMFADIYLFPLIGASQQGAVLRLDDVTERALMEENMIQSEKMLSVGGLAAGMAHEINNPLGIIMQGTQSIQRRIDPSLEANQAAARELGLDMDRLVDYMERRRILHYLGGVREAGDRAGAIVRSMLDFSRRSETVRAPRDVNQLLDMAVELAGKDYDLKKRFDFRKIEIDRQYDDSLPDLPVIETELQQVFLNLLRNAAQAMFGKEYPEGQGPRIVLRTRREQGQVVIEVEDNGPGMDEETRQRVFEPFFTTKEAGVGTGLGLSVSYFIITRNHGGSLSVHSFPGRGATFVLRLPIKPDAV